MDASMDGWMDERERKMKIGCMYAWKLLDGQMGRRKLKQQPTITEQSDFTKAKFKGKAHSLL